MMKKQWLLIGTCFVCLGFTSACSSLDHEGNMALQRLEIHQENYSEEFTSHNLTQEMLNAIAADYQRNGSDKPLNIMVQYDPSSSLNTAMNATHHVAKISQGLQQAGVSNVQAEIMPVNNIGDHSQTLVTYARYSAHAPSECGALMPGLDNTRTDWEAARDYQFGCSVETKIARQIARPKDLLGREGFATDADGRRASNIIEIHRMGTPNESLDGETASED